MNKGKAYANKKRVSLKNIICKIESCSSKAITKYLCKKHYSRLIRHGNPLTVFKMHESHNMKNTPEYSSWQHMI